MPNLEPYRLSARELARRVADRTVSAEAVVRSCLERIRARESVVRAWTHVAGEAALERARALDRAPASGLLAGVPFAAKDIFDSVDMPTGYGSPIYTGCRPGGDASALALPRSAGGILLGKTVTTEFANRHPGPTTNPHDPAFSPGGSSSGSAAAVADCMVPLAVGTQTGGSVIRPAAYCGIVGFKPSFGMFAPAGMRANTEALDTVGIMARSVGDIALFAAAMMAVPDEPSVPLATPPKLALCRTPAWDVAQPEGQAALLQAATALAAAGAVVVEAELPTEAAAAADIQRRLAAFEGPRNHAPELYRHADLLSPRLAEDRIEAGRAVPLAEFRAARREAERARLAAAQWALAFDAVLTLPAPGEAPRGLASTGSAIFNAPWTLLYVPCLTLPWARGPNGLPLGIQLVGRRHGDRRLLDIGAWVEERLGAGR